MAINTTFPGGGSQTATVNDGPASPDMDFYRLMGLRSASANHPTGPGRTRGTGPVLREGLGIDTTDRSRMPADNRVSYQGKFGSLTGAGGFYGAPGGGPGTAWGGDRPQVAAQNDAFLVNRGGNPGGGGVDPNFKTEEQKRAEMLGGLGPSLAQNQLRERLTLGGK
jgi:hypothetical protein